MDPGKGSGMIGINTKVGVVALLDSSGVVINQNCNPLVVPLLLYLAGL
jgi:hypothetical protein